MRDLRSLPSRVISFLCHLPEFANVSSIIRMARAPSARIGRIACYGSVEYPGKACAFLSYTLEKCCGLTVRFSILYATPCLLCRVVHRRRSSGAHRLYPTFPALNSLCQANFFLAVNAEREGKGSEGASCEEEHLEKQERWVCCSMACSSSLALALARSGVLVPCRS